LRKCIAREAGNLKHKNTAFKDYSQIVTIKNLLEKAIVRKKRESSIHKQHALTSQEIKSSATEVVLTF
jgi:hypothetical protein